MRLCLLGLFLILLAATARASTTEGQIQKLVEGYHSFQTFLDTVSGVGSPRPLPPGDEAPDTPRKPPHRPRPPNHCDPDYDEGAASRSCIEAVCNQLSYFDCNTRDRILEITRHCRNVRGSCVKTICSRVSSFECDSRSELFRVTDMCRGLYDASCIDYVCSRLPRFDCDELSEIRRIADQCR